MMATKKELEKQIQTQEKKIDEFERELKDLKYDYEKFSGFLGTLGYTMQEIYRCYPHIIGEVCTEKQIVKIFRIQSELNEFIREIQKRKQKEDKDGGFDEI